LSARPVLRNEYAADVHGNRSQLSRNLADDQVETAGLPLA
jgi:hypothetical protein